MAITLTATPDPSYSPPRVRLAFQDTAGTPVTSVVIYRRDADGYSRKVRTSDDGPLPVSGGLASLDDYEAPFGVTVTYTMTGQTVTATTQLDSGTPWLVHIGVPSRSVPADFRIGTNDEESWAVDQGVFSILGRSKPIVITGGARLAASSSLIVSAETRAERDGLEQLLADASPLLLNVPPALGLNIDTEYIAAGSVTTRRISSIGSAPYWDVTIPYQVIDRPAGGTQAAITWATVAAQYPTWQDIAAAGLSWADLVSPTN